LGVRGVAVMPYCGRCLNVGRNLDTGVLLRQAQPTPNRASMRFAGSRRSSASYRVNSWTRARSCASTLCNRRGVRTRMPTDGGGRERDEAAKYRGDAKASARCDRERPRYWRGSPLDMKRTRSTRIKAPSKGIGRRNGGASPVDRSASFMKACPAGRRRVPPW
jgi:hypothetical protein